MDHLVAVRSFGTTRTEPVGLAMLVGVSRPLLLSIWSVTAKLWPFVAAHSFVATSARRRSVNRTAAKMDSRDSIDEMNLIHAQLLLARLLAYGAVSASQHIFKALSQSLLVHIMTPPIRYALAALQRLPRQHFLSYLPGQRSPSTIT